MNSQWFAYVAILYIVLFAVLQWNEKRERQAATFDSEPSTTMAEGPALAAVQFLEAAERKGIKVESVDVSDPTVVRAHLESGVKLVISWNEMGRNTDKSRIAIDEKTARLKMVLKSDTGKHHNNFEFTEDSRVYADGGETEELQARHVQATRRVAADNIITETHIVQRGEDVRRISMQWLVSEDRIREFNALGKKEEVQPGRTLLIPLSE